MRRSRAGDPEGKQIIGRSGGKANIINPLCQERCSKQVLASASIITLFAVQRTENCSIAIMCEIYFKVLYILVCCVKHNVNQRIYDTTLR